MLHLLKSKILNSSARTLKAGKNILTMFIIKGVSIVVNLAMVPLLINTLNTDRYGIWLTITSLLALFSFLDIGIGHGLRNRLGTAIAKEDFSTAQKLVSTAYLALSFIIAIILILFLFSNQFINWGQILNSPAVLNVEIQGLMLFVIGFFLINFILRLLTSIMYAFQIPAFAELIITLGQLFSYLTILLLKHLNFVFSLKDLGIILSAFPLIVLLIFTLILFNGKYKKIKPKFKSFDIHLIRHIFSLGVKFFLIQISSILIFQTSILVIAHVLGSSSVTEYNIAYKYLGLLTLGFTIITTPFWSAATDAFAKKDFVWMEHAIISLKKIWWVFCLIGVFLLLGSNVLYKVWLGTTIKSNIQLLVLLFLFNIIQMRWSLYGMILNGIGKVKLQLYLTVIQALIHIPLSIVLTNHFGISGVLLSMIIVTFANSIWPVVQFNLIKTNQAKGIWNK